MNIGISTIHLLSTMQGWISELFSYSIQLSRMLPTNDEKVAPPHRLLFRRNRLVAAAFLF
jgi:hypothetical protein